LLEPERGVSFKKLKNGLKINPVSIERGDTRFYTLVRGDI